MKQLNNEHPIIKKNIDKLPEKVLQFGEGKFLRAFADWMIHEANCKGLFGGSVVVVPPRSDKSLSVFHKQDNLYTLYLRGIQEGEKIEVKQVISSISRALSPRQQWGELLVLVESRELKFIISNTTEAGITYQPEPYRERHCPESFPAKLTSLLFHRYKHFQGAKGTGIILLPCELLAENGTALKEIVLSHTRDWQLPQGFRQWLAEEALFLNSLVDRIVTGIAPEEMADEWSALGYRDELLNAAEPYHLWVIAAPEEIRSELPLDKADLNLIWVDDVKPYRTRKVRILNGAHTATVAIALLQGLETVRDAVEDELTGSFLKGALFDEIIPSFQGWPEDELVSFARDTLERFQNPYIHHCWTDISVNSISKFRERVLPSMLDYYSLHQELPLRLTCSLAALLALYKNAGADHSSCSGFIPQDDPAVLSTFKGLWAEAADVAPGAIISLTVKALSQEIFWGSDLNRIPGLTEKVAAYLKIITDRGATAVLAHLDAAVS